MTALIFFGAVYGWCAGMIAIVVVGDGDNDISKTKVKGKSKKKLKELLADL